MAYFVRPVDRDLMPRGHDWLFLQMDDGDATFLIARDAGVVELGAEVIATIVRPVARATGLPIQLAG